MSADPHRVAVLLGAWYAQNARTLPWRDDPSPYAVLLSELMLQQTRVDTVIPYFHDFMRRWPTLADLAAATEDEVLEAWAGLGYYSRARNLLRCAREVEAEGLPADPQALRRLPGIGPYTAGAIASIAFGVRTGLVDGNVERVLSRLDASEVDPRSSAGKRALWDRVEGLQQAHEGHPGDLNQALMELGAMVCQPRTPRCEICPLADVCVGRARGVAASLPRKAKKKPPVPVYGVSGLLRCEGRVLMGQRPKSGLLGGLWEPISADVDADADPVEALREAFLERCGLRVEVGAPLGQIVHVFTHRRLSCRVYDISAAAGELQRGTAYVDLRWVEGASVALSSLARKILALGERSQLALPLAADRTRVAKT